MTLKTVLVDDEVLARDMLRVLLTRHPDIDVIASCKSADEAVKVLRENHCDLLFLDIQMPRKDGFAVLEEIGVGRIPATVFVTAYHEHAVRAFEVHAVDYLTKPTNAERLNTALRRARERIRLRSGLSEERLESLLLDIRNRGLPQPSPITRLLVKDVEREVLLPVRQIEWIESASYYCRLHHKGRAYMHRQTMAELEDALDPTRFVRVHRKAIVNLDFVAEVFREGRTGSSLRLHSGMAVPVSQTGIKLFDSVLSSNTNKAPIPADGGEQK